MADSTVRLADDAARIADDIARMSAVADWAVRAIVEQLALTATALGGIAEMLANPTETAAAEFYRRGCHALSSKWLPEAATDLLEAVRLYPYNPLSWFALGIERQRDGQAGATDAFDSTEQDESTRVCADPIDRQRRGARRVSAGCG
jgi:hypothetical protein